MEPRAFYAAALSCLRFAEQRSPTGRRFGDDADVRWKAFRGHLTTADRIDMLLRDADVEFPGAFGARTTFALRGVAEDEAFGPQWASLHPKDAESLWRQVVRDAAPPKDLRDALRSIASSWELPLEPFAVPPITPTSRFVAAGPSAIAALVEAFAERSDLSWSDQVACLATPPAHRHLAASAAALLRSSKPTVLNPSTIKGEVVVSPDADPIDRARL